MGTVIGCILIVGLGAFIVYEIVSIILTLRKRKKKHGHNKEVTTEEVVNDNTKHGESE